MAERNPLVARPELLAPRVLGFVALVSAVGAALTYEVLVRTRAGQSLDVTVFGRMQSLPYQGVAGEIRTGIIVVASVAVAGAALGSLWRHRWRAVLASVVSIALSLWLAELVKDSLTRPYLGSYSYVRNTFPSAHMATATALCIAVVVLWPRASDRWVVVAIAAYVVCVEGVYNVTGFAHRPSDVLGGFLLAVAISAVALVVCGVPADTQWRRDARLS